MDFFYDVTIANAVKSGGAFSSGKITYFLPQYFSFCGGVIRAVQKVVGECESLPANGRILLLGEVVHNPDVNRWFVGQGAVILSADEILQIEAQVKPGDVLIIPAFGVVLDIFKRLNLLKGIRLVDTTCADVRVIWDYVERKSAAGYSVILHGKVGHPETEAIVSRVAEGVRVKVFSTFDKVARFIVESGDELGFNKVAFAQQTTMPAAETERIKALLQENVEEGGGVFEACHSICPATQQRQDSAIALCRQPLDMVFVVGGFDSSNTAELFSIASKSTTAFYIENESDLRWEKIRHFCPKLGSVQTSENWLKGCAGDAGLKVGLLAGASTPKSTVGAVIRKLDELLND